jgi:hypothetical protein
MAAGANSERMTGLRRFRRVVDSWISVAGPWLVAVNLIQVKFEFVDRLVILGDLAQWFGSRTLIGKATHDWGGEAGLRETTVYFSSSVAYLMGTARFEPPKSLSTAKFMPITFPLRLKRGAPEPPEVVAAS